MRYLGTLGLMVLAMVVMMAGAGGVSATSLTSSPPPPPYTGTVKAESEGAIVLDGTINLTCQKSALEWNVEIHGASAAARGPLTALTLEECKNDTVTIVNRGRLELHATGNGNGTMTWTNAEITVVTHSLFLGTRHCIYETDETDVGTLTGSSATKGTATLDIDSRPIPQVTTDSLCGNDAELTGSYKFTSPDYLDVD